MRRRRRLRNAPSSKSELVESLLRLGDIARNNQVGEVTVALDKAKQLIDKYGLSYLLPTYQKLVDKVAAFQRGEKVGRDDASHSRSSGWQQTDGETSDRYQYYRQKGREQRQRAKAERYKQWYEQQRQKEEAKRSQGRQRKSRTSTTGYKRPRKSAGIEWLWTKSWSPKRGKSGERWKAYYGAATIEEMLARGGRWSDVKWNVTHNLMRIRQPDE